MKLFPAFLQKAVLGAVLAVMMTSAFAQEARESSGRSETKSDPSAETKESSSKAKPVEVQVLLDRARFSPGPIDNLWGSAESRSRRALAAFQKASGLPPSGDPDPETMARLTQAGGNQPALTEYQLTAEDVAGPFLGEIPEDWKARSQLPQLGYTNAMEMIAERYHVDLDYLKKLNPKATFTQAGETLQVPNVEPFVWPAPVKKEEKSSGETETASAPKGSKENTITVSEPDLSLTVQAPDGSILFYAPITPGSEKLPLPDGQLEIKAFDRKPVYYFDPAVIPEAKVDEKLKIAPGPNNPVGVVWIDLSKERYGIHGTPEPDKIGYSTSHGCVRLTNWDATHVSGLVAKGSVVNFVRK